MLRTHMRIKDMTYERHDVWLCTWSWACIASCQLIDTHACICVCACWGKLVSKCLALLSLLSLLSLFSLLSLVPHLSLTCLTFSHSSHICLSHSHLSHLSHTVRQVQDTSKCKTHPSARHIQVPDTSKCKTHPSATSASVSLVSHKSDKWESLTCLTSIPPLPLGLPTHQAADSHRCLPYLSRQMEVWLSERLSHNGGVIEWETLTLGVIEWETLTLGYPT